MPVAAHQVGDPEQLPGLCRGELEKLLFGIGGMIPQRGSLAACLALDVTNTFAVIGALSIGAAAGISLSFQPSLHWSGLASTVDSRSKVSFECIHSVSTSGVCSCRDRPSDPPRPARTG